ncbi:MAG: UDP-glucose 6-dehydrogenase [Rhodospirillaceae bacterium]|nr:UDP-glucose 6-dehydrogenase [Rhodospirillaceae bacterium]|tara:strand:- start:1273 stop:2607 length:1335 start_codon:yes stop_codon:yes gene_type:complete
MNIVMIGTGYVGLVSGVCFSELGNNVVCVDKDKKIIDNLNSGIVPIFEPSLEDLVHKNMKKGRLRFSKELKSEINSADIIFIAVGTPRGKENGEADLSSVFGVAEELSESIDKDMIVAMKSTVPVGTMKIIENIFKSKPNYKKIKTASVPEFLREGLAVQDFMGPSRVVVGSNYSEAHSILYKLHQPLIKSNKDLYFETDPQTAELTKYASNAFLAVKISFINEISNLCEKVGANVEDVADGMGLDKRIGRWGLSAGPGYGGSCFPKDTLALIHTASQNESPLRIVEAAVSVNDSRKAFIFSKISEEFNNDLRNKNFCILGLTFKAGTDDLRDSPSMDLIPKLIEYGSNIRAYDPQGIDEARKKIEGSIVWCKNLYQAVENVDAIIFMTEWPEFDSKNIDFKKVANLVNQKTIIDFRNMYKPSYLTDLGFHYISLGRKVGRPLG